MAKFSRNRTQPALNKGHNTKLSKVAHFVWASQANKLKLL